MSPSTLGIASTVAGITSRVAGFSPPKREKRLFAFYVITVLKALAPKYMAKPGLGVPTKIKDSTRFYSYFKDCVGAIDGTHILAMITGQDSASYRNRKGKLSQNVLAACNFNLEFTYILSGWEGSAYDTKRMFLPEEDGNNEEENDVDERYDDGNNEEEQLHGTQEQQRVLANNWRAIIAATMWTYAINMGS
ncbi:uncharacterized protein LOC111829985 [Capsella rubella]|uniref:uncharacterized protein LOC111829985 n=1 Tax=Capsella rubella TaxID=81985 RepID=UPI000CD4DB83|nr:uncharacterized protein LOC111829985 [Capsella rubella]